VLGTKERYVKSTQLEMGVIGESEVVLVADVEIGDAKRRTRENGEMA